MMAIVMKAICDLCLNEDNREVAGNTVLISIGKHGQVAVELCDDHEQRVLRPVEQLLIEHGRNDQGKSPYAPKGHHKATTAAPRTKVVPRVNPRPASRVGPPIGCPYCDRVLPNRQGLSRHLRTLHDTSILAAVNEGLLPRTKRTPLIIDLTEIECPDCGMMVRGTKGMGGHKRIHAA